MQHVQAPFSGERRRVGGSAAAPQQMGPPTMHIPVFLDRIFRMIENVPDDVVCWSKAGDSFIIKQVRLFEELLPSYYNHNKFMSFVRQLNFYGFQKVKGKASSRLSSAGDGDAHGMATATVEPEEHWAEFRHPQFRRGRRDLLVGITRQKDSGRLKRQQADARKSDIISALATDVITVGDDLRTVNGKLDSIMSLLLNMGSGKNQAAATLSNAIPQPQDNIIRDDGAAGAAAAAAATAAASEGGGGVSFGGGGAQDGNTAFFTPSAASTATARGGLDQWLEDGDIASSSAGRVGGDPYAHGTLLDYRPTPRRPVDHQLQEEPPEHALYSQLPQQPSPAEGYPVVPNQIRYDVVQPRPPLPSLGAAVGARASESAPVGPSRQQLPPLHLSPPRPFEGATSSPSERKQGGEGKGKTSPESSPPSRGDESGVGGGFSPSCASAGGDPHGARWQRQQWEQRGLMHPVPPQQNRETASVDAGGSRAGGWCVAVANQAHQGLLDGATSMI